MPGHNILLIEDTDDIRFLVKAGLEKNGYVVKEAERAEAGLNHLKAGFVPQAILLDLMLPDKNGLDIIDDIRAYTNAPLILVTAKGELVERIVGFEVGADDYIVKPFQMQELLARVKAHIRRYMENNAPSRGKRIAKIKFPGWVLDYGRYQAYDEKGATANLTAKEFRLLAVLAEAPHKVFTREQLLDKSREDDMNVTDRAIDTQINRIRKKLKEGEARLELIEAVRGIGYCFTASIETIYE